LLLNGSSEDEPTFFARVSLLAVQVKALSAQLQAYRGLAAPEAADSDAVSAALRHSLESVRGELDVAKAELAQVSPVAASAASNAALSSNTARVSTPPRY
jgi:hypothetical protein